MAVPEVILHRLSRMNDPQELFRMGSEKVGAFNEAWSAMAMQAFVENQRLALSFTQSLWSPWNPWMRILEQGIGPVRRRARANARRLRRY